MNTSRCPISMSLIRIYTLSSFAFLLLLTFGFPSEASAFERSVTCGPPSNAITCEAGESAKFVEWHSSCVVIHLNESASGTTPNSTLESITKTSIDTWNEPSCSGFSLIYGGLSNESRVGYFPFESKNSNIFLFRDSGWTHGGEILALTSVTYDIVTGKIVDADIEFNSESYQFTTSDQGGIEIDVLNTMTHEIGHFLGLDHSRIPTSTMFSTAPFGETDKRSLHDDDIAGLCEIYPQNLTASCNESTAGYYSSPEGEVRGGGSGDTCQVTSFNKRNKGAESPLALQVGLLLLGGFLFWRRRERSEQR